MKIKRNIVRIDEEKCNGCGVCVSACAEGAILIIDGKAKLKAENLCDGLGACLGECPQGALQVIESEVDAFDASAVQRQGHGAPVSPGPNTDRLPCRCPSQQLQTFPAAANCQTANKPVRFDTEASALAHWPVQIRLVPAHAPFLQGCHLLVAADCTPVAYPNFHRDFLDGKTVLIGCPKFDETETYVQKFADIFTQANILKVTVVVMEVPCCQGLPSIVHRGMALAGKTVPLEIAVISPRGHIVRRSDPSPDHP